MSLPDSIRKLEAELAAERSPQRQRELFLRIGRALEDLGLYAEAVETYARAATPFGDAEVLQGWARALECLRLYPQLVGVIRRQLAVENAPERRALLHARLGTVLETALGDEAGAMEQYRKSLALAPSFEPPAQGLLDLAERRQDWHTVVEVLEIKLRIESRARERATLLTRLGQVVARHLRDPQGAVGFLERAVRQNPQWLAPRLLLLELLCEQGRFNHAERFATPPEVTDGRGLSADEVARLCRLRSRVARECGRLGEALDCLGLAVEVTPHPREVLEEMALLAREHRVEALPPEPLSRRNREWAKTQPELAAFGESVAGLLYRNAGRVEEAEATFRRAIAHQPERVEWHLLLEQLREELRDFTGAIDLLRHAAQLPSADRPELLCRAARLYADHLGQPEQAAALIEVLHEEGRATEESRLLAAELALALGDPARARGEIDQADPLVSPARRSELEALRVRLATLEGSPGPVVESALERAAREGELRALSWFSDRAIAERKGSEVEAIFRRYPPERRTLAARVIGDAFRRAGRHDAALWWYRDGLQDAGGGAVELIEGLAAIAPGEALHLLEQRLTQEPFDARGLLLLSTVLSATGEQQRAEGLFRLSEALRLGEMRSPQVVLDHLWDGIPPADPFLDLVAQLRYQAAPAFEKIEAELFQVAEPIDLPRPVAEILRRACEMHRIPVPAIAHHPRVDARPLSLASPLAVVVSSQLTSDEMPPGALLFAILEGLLPLAAWLGPITYLADYQLDVFAEALRQAAHPKSERVDAITPATLIGNVLDVQAHEAAAILAESALRQEASRADAANACHALEAATMRNVLLATRDLLSGLAAMSLLPPPVMGFRAARGRWLRQLSKLPRARAAMNFTLSEHFATLAARRSA